METVINIPTVSKPGEEFFSTDSAGESHQKIIKYYEDAGPDYEEWSKNYNMHFGHGSLLDFFDREKMLERMNEKVLTNLGLLYKDSAEVLDMGCGLGATLRHGVRMFPKIKFSGITLVPWQIQKGAEINNKQNLDSSINLVRGDYTNSPFSSGRFDAVYAIESACHSEGNNKEDFIKEMKRVLKTGGSFSIADGFVKNPQVSFDPFTKMCYRTICENWALSSMAEISAFKECLIKHGFKNIVVEDISWSVAPSALHAPYVVCKFLIKKLLQREVLKPQSISNLKGSLMALLLGMCRWKFGYYIIKGQKA